MIAFFYNLSVVFAVLSGFILFINFFYKEDYKPDITESICFYVFIFSLVFLYTFH